MPRAMQLELFRSRLDRMSEQELEQELARVCGRFVFFQFCCPNDGNCEYREFCELLGPVQPKTYREAMIEAICNAT